MRLVRAIGRQAPQRLHVKWERLRDILHTTAPEHRTGGAGAVGSGLHCHRRQVQRNGVLCHLPLRGQPLRPGALGAAGASATTRVAGTEVGARAQRAAEASATTRVAGTEVGVPATLAGKPEILDGEEIQERVGGATGDVDPTPAFFIRLILRVLWRRVLR